MSGGPLKGNVPRTWISFVNYTERLNVEKEKKVSNWHFGTFLVSATVLQIA